ncbi:MAG: type I 3-dehydroquinate dehydratase [Nitrososphaerales archaeon]
MSNKICVSLGTSDINELKKLVSDSLSSNTDFIEVRFDYFDRSRMNEVLEFVVDHKEKAVFTCRAPNEGGKYTGPETDRVTTLRRLAAFRPMFLDVEYSTMVANDDLMDQFTAQNCEILVSWHNFDLTPSIEELGSLLNKMKEYSTNVKIVTMAKNIGDNLTVLKLYETAKRSNINLIAFCMGESGILSRVLCTYAGAPFTYASLTDAIAPGQLTLKQMRSIYDRLENERTELNDYNSWKDRQELDDVIKIINDAKG